MVDTPPSDLELDLLLEAIYQKYKYDFRQYSRASLHRRTQTALVQLRVSSLSALQSRVLHEKEFFFELLQYLTVPVTELFREPAFFHLLREQIIPHLKTYASLKLWVAGCSTGEEAYSLAILLREEGLLDRTLIYATDINPKSLKIAQEGIYPSALLAKYAQNYQKAGGQYSFSDYYEEGYGSISILPSLKNHVLFTDHSLATDNVFSEVQFVSCRNVMIYFQKPLQDRAIQLFHESLVPGGFLGIGEKESLRFSSIGHEFETLGTSARIFKKKIATRRGHAPFRGNP